MLPIPSRRLTDTRHRVKLAVKMKTLTQVVGERIREIRETERKSQEQLALAVRQLGLDWVRGTIASIETGARDLSFTYEVFVLAAALGRPVKDLLPDADEKISVAGVLFSGKDLEQMLTASPSKIRHRVLHAPTLAVTVKASEAELRIEARGEAERKVAARLGVDPLDVAKAARRLWNRAWTAERDRRISAPGATPRSLQARRGHASREMLKELQEELR
jgi:transcriptional regulator with XRE-family HTH domain